MSNFRARFNDIRGECGDVSEAMPTRPRDAGLRAVEFKLSGALRTGWPGRHVRKKPIPASSLNARVEVGGNARPLLLLIDADATNIHDQVCDALGTAAYRVETANTAEAGLMRMRSSRPDVILLDVHLPDQRGIDVFERIRELNHRVPVIFVTESKTADTAIEAMKRGAFDYLFKPLAPSELPQVVNRAIDVARRMREPLVAEESATSELQGTIVGSCPAMREVYKAIGRVSAQNLPVLITGESGTGKELVARSIYQHGTRSDGPFLALNCAAIPETLLESELFGHEKGAFTGAERRRIGKFEQCHGGTIFLDEIGDMPLTLQAKILRLLQEQTFERVGGNEEIRTDVRVIAATHRDLKAWSAEGKFRPDLYYRLSVFAIDLPALRRRGSDLPLLARHYLRRFSRELGRDVRDFAPEALARLEAHDWPGNIRELQSVLKQGLLAASGRVLLPEFLPEFGGAVRGQAPAPRDERPGIENFIRHRLNSSADDLYAHLHRDMDEFLLPLVLKQTNGNQHRAARRLGIARQTLRMKLRELGMQVTTSIDTSEQGSLAEA